jgi:small subunit ribosomal protein S20
MPHHKSCKKRIKTAKKSRVSNRQIKSRIKSAVKNIRDAKDKETSQDALKNVYSIFDKAVKAKVIHKNKAANQKSKLTATVK